LSKRERKREGGGIRVGLHLPAKLREGPSAEAPRQGTAANPLGGSAPTRKGNACTGERVGHDTAISLHGGPLGGHRRPSLLRHRLEEDMLFFLKTVVFTSSMADTLMFHFMYC
jgi:hypothetical protein